VRADILVVGAGLAGSATACALALRGARVTLTDDANPAAGTRVPLGVMAPYPSPPTDRLTRLRLRGARYTTALLRRLEAAGLDSGRRAHGAILVPATERDRRRRDRAQAVSAPTTRRLSPAQARREQGISLDEDALVHSLGACIEPIQLAASLRQWPANGLTFTQCGVSNLAADANGWLARDRDARPIGYARHVVVAAGPWSTHLRPELAERLTPSRGQVSRYPADATTRHLRLPISAGGFVTPALDGDHWAGASAEPGIDTPYHCAADDATNRQRLQRLGHSAGASQRTGHWVGIRALTPNRLPLAGQLAPGLWVNSGHGAHGLMTAPMIAVRLAQRLIQTDATPPA
jgi:tRNA U-34 5-methylaminomethyl-2-thiouridine biosynthesis protein MnmC